MRTNSKNGLNKPNDIIVFDIPEASVTDRGRAKKLRGRGGAGADHDLYPALPLL